MIKKSGLNFTALDTGLINSNKNNHASVTEFFSELISIFLETFFQVSFFTN